MNFLDDQLQGGSSIAARHIPNNRRNDAMRDYVCELYKQGKSVKQIGKIIGRNHSLAYKWVNQAGLLDPERKSGGKNRKSNHGVRRTDVWLRRAWESEWPKGMDSHWSNHPEVALARSRATAMRIYKDKKHDAKWMEKRRATTAKWQRNNIDQARASKRVSYKRWKKKPENRAACSQRRRFKEIMGCKNQLKTRDMIGCSPMFLRAWLEAQFRRGMSWDNYGTAWSIDHKIPCAKFDLSNPMEVRKCFHYSNLQPLTIAENTAKCDRIKPTQPELCMAI